MALIIPKHGDIPLNSAVPITARFPASGAASIAPVENRERSRKYFRKALITVFPIKRPDTGKQMIRRTFNIPRCLLPPYSQRTFHLVKFGLSVWLAGWQACSCPADIFFKENCPSRLSPPTPTSPKPPPPAPRSCPESDPHSS